MGIQSRFFITQRIAGPRDLQPTVRPERAWPSEVRSTARRHPVRQSAEYWPGFLLVRNGCLANGLDID